MRATTTRRLIHHTTFFIILFALLSSTLPLHAAASQRRTPRPNRSGESAVGWQTVPSILARIRPPRFPARDFRITDHGARGDGRADNTDAIRKAVAAAHAAGGGRVVVPAGTFLTGAIHLKS